MRACGFLNANPGSQLHIQYFGSLMRNSEGMPSYFVALLVAVVLLYCVAPRTRAQTAQNRGSQATASPGTNSTQIARGKYIVEGLAICGMCHTPRTDSGEIDQSRWLDGASLWLLPALLLVVLPAIAYAWKDSLAIDRDRSHILALVNVLALVPMSLVGRWVA